MPMITTSTTVAQMIPGNKNRKSLIVTNTGTADSVGVRIFMKNPTPPTTAAYDILLGPGIQLSLNLLEDGPFEVQSPFWLIALTNAPVVAWEETLA